MPACRDIPYVLDKLNWMRAERLWPNGQRYTWTDAFGVVLLVSLYAELGKPRFLDEAEWVVSEVDRVLGRPRGIRIGEAPDRDGQYFHYLAMWLYAWPRKCISRASISGERFVDSGMRSTRATKNGQPLRNSSIWKRCSPWQTSCAPSGPVT